MVVPKIGLWAIAQPPFRVLPSADVGLIFTAYNLKQIFNLIDQNMLKRYLKALALLFWPLKDVFKPFYTLLIFESIASSFLKKGFYCKLKPIYLRNN